LFSRSVSVRLIFSPFSYLCKKKICKDSGPFNVLWNSIKVEFL